MTKSMAKAPECLDIIILLLYIQRKVAYNGGATSVEKANKTT